MFVAVTYCNIPILVVIDTYHTRQKICGERLLRQYKYFVAKGLFQQNRYWWRQVVVATDKIFVAKGYYNNTNILWQEYFFNKNEMVASNSYFNRRTVRCDKLLRQYKLFHRNSLVQQSR
jgi:hypothetical protein